MSLVDFVNVLKENEPRLRNSYEETIEICSDKFLEIIMVDATFIIELMLRYYILLLDWLGIIVKVGWQYVVLFMTKYACDMLVCLWNDRNSLCNIVKVGWQCFVLFCMSYPKPWCQSPCVKYGKTQIQDVTYMVIYSWCRRHTKILEMEDRVFSGFILSEWECFFGCIWGLGYVRVLTCYYCNLPIL